jgi:hypothetical protein
MGRTWFFIICDRVNLLTDSNKHGKKELFADL